MDVISPSLGPAFVSPRATVEEGVEIGPGTRIWANTHIRENVRIGHSCTIGESCYIDAAVTIGSSSKIQNSALIFSPATVGEGVFIGPAAILTNDRLPRATGLGGHRKNELDWKREGVVVERGASIGAAAVCIAPVTIGAFAMVGAGAVVTQDVRAHSLVVGVPAKHVGWVGKSGERLVREGDFLKCLRYGETYFERDGFLVPEEVLDT